MKKCPFCAEEIQDEAIVCKHCRRDIHPPIESVSEVVPDVGTPPEPVGKSSKTIEMPARETDAERIGTSRDGDGKPKTRPYKAIVGEMVVGLVLVVFANLAASDASADTGNLSANAAKIGFVGTMMLLFGFGSLVRTLKARRPAGSNTILVVAGIVGLVGAAVVLLVAVLWMHSFKYGFWFGAGIIFPALIGIAASLGLLADRNRHAYWAGALMGLGIATAGVYLVSQLDLSDAPTHVMGLAYLTIGAGGLLGFAGTGGEPSSGRQRSESRGER